AGFAIDDARFRVEFAEPVAAAHEQGFVRVERRVAVGTPIAPRDQASVLRKDRSNFVRVAQNLRSAGDRRITAPAGQHHWFSLENESTSERDNERRYHCKAGQQTYAIRDREYHGILMHLPASREDANAAEPIYQDNANSPKQVRVPIK